MTLEQFAYVAQIVGVMVVVASLIYLARQVAQGTELMRANAAAERIQRDFELSSAVANSREFTEVWNRGRSDFAGLDENDQLRLIFHERRAIKHWHNMYGLHRDGVLPEPDWAELTWLIRFIGRNQGLRAAWETFRDSFEEPFQDFVDQQLAAADRPATDY
jgi:hypothetical protein